MVSIAVLGAGWFAHALTCARTLPAAAAATPPVAVENACVDTTAMAANANLVEDLRVARARLARVEEHERETTAKLGRAETALPRQLGQSRDEWLRMARQHTITVRTPCTDWRSTRGWTLHRQNGIRARRDTSDARSRAQLAGLSAEEAEALTEVYRRTNDRTWSRIRATCEGNDAYKSAIAELVESDEDGSQSDPAASLRIGLCQSTLLSAHDDDGRAAIARVAELRAAGKSDSRASGDREHVLFALTESPGILHEEMVQALGREKAAAVLDQGVICLDESVYDLRS